MSDHSRVISDYQQFHTPSRSQFDQCKGKEKRDLYKLNFPSTSIDSGTCTNSTSTDEMPCVVVVNKSSNSLTSVAVVQHPDSLESIPLDDQQRPCSTNNSSTNGNRCNDSYLNSNSSKIGHRDWDKKLYKQKSQYVEDDDDDEFYIYANPINQHDDEDDDEAEETALPPEDAKEWRRESIVSSRTVKCGDSKSDLHNSLKLMSTACLKSDVSPRQQVTCNVLRTTHIDDHAYGRSKPSSLCTCPTNDQQRRSSLQHSNYQASFSRGAGSQSSMYDGTNLSTINTSGLSLESNYSSNASERNPLTSYSLQTTAIDHEFERPIDEANCHQWRENHVSSDSEDSDIDVHSDICESLESLVDHGIDSDASISTEGSDDSDDDSIDLRDEVKNFEDRDIGDGSSLPSPGVSTTMSDDFTTISLTRDYYPVKEDPPIGTIGQMYPWLRFSLFPNIPPTINFRIMDSPPLNIPPEVKRILKWKSTAVTPAIIRRVLYNSGMRIVKRSRQWIGIWSKHMRANLFKTIKDFQKFNHFPGTFQIGRKDTLWRNHVRLRNIHGKKSYDFLPVTYVIPSDMKQLRHAWEKSSPHQMWIIKPPASARGSGIKIIHKFMQIPKIRPLIVQKYLSSPFLINGVKFDLRIYVYITSFYPLRIYVYKEGLVRFASVMYSSCPRTVSDRYMHLTNYSVNRKSVTYTANEDVNACKGHKWSLKALWGYLTEKGFDTSAIWNSIVDIVIKTIISCETTVSTLTRLNLKNANSSHELFGFDIILDSNLKPWLLEVNISPSLQSTSKLDASIKGQMCKDLLNLAGVNIPPHLEKSYQQSFLEKICLDAGYEIESLCYDKRLYRCTLTTEERAKQIAFSRMERHEYLPTVLQNLLPDDIRHLVIAEDERSRAGQYIRVYPTITSHRYHKFFDRPRYYNHLFDAWEMQYANCRMEGIQRLVAACKNGLHVKAVVKESTKVSSPRTDVGRLSSTTSLRVRCCSRSATNRAIQRACRSARNLFARMRMNRHCPATKKDLEDAKSSSHTGSGDQLLRSTKASDKETEESSLGRTPISPNSAATTLYGSEEPYDGIHTSQQQQQMKNSKNSKASSSSSLSSPPNNSSSNNNNNNNCNSEHALKQSTHYTTIGDYKLNAEKQNKDGTSAKNKLLPSNPPNGVVRVPHCRGCALLAQNYRAAAAAAAAAANNNSKKVTTQDNCYPKSSEVETQLLDSAAAAAAAAPVHNASFVNKSSNNQPITKVTAYPGHIGVDSNN